MHHKVSLDYFEIIWDIFQKKGMKGEKGTQNISGRNMNILKSKQACLLEQVSNGDLKGGGPFFLQPSGLKKIISSTVY